MIKTTQKVLPDGYTELEYITNSGGSFITLPYGFSSSDEIEFAWKISNSTADKFLIAPTTWNNDSNRFAMGGGGTVVRFGVGFGDISTQQLMHQTTKDTTDFHTETYSNRMFTLDGTDTVNVSNVTFGSETDSLKLFHGYNSNTTGSIKSYRQKKNSVLVLDLVPCKNASNQVGMYDLVSKTFYGNNGTGDFIAGPVGNVKNVAKIITTQNRKNEFRFNDGTGTATGFSYVSSNQAVTRTCTTAVGTTYLVQNAVFDSLVATTELPAGTYKLNVDVQGVSVSGIYLGVTINGVSQQWGNGTTLTATSPITINSVRSANVTYAAGETQTIKISIIPEPREIKSIYTRSKNLLNDENIVTAYNANGNYLYKGYFINGKNIYTADNRYRTAHLNLKAGTYTFWTDTANAYLIRYAIDNIITSLAHSRQYLTITLPNDSEFSLCWRNYDTSEIQGEKSAIVSGDTPPTAYQPYMVKVYQKASA